MIRDQREEAEVLDRVLFGGERPAFDVLWDDVRSLRFMIERAKATGTIKTEDIECLMRIQKHGVCFTEQHKEYIRIFSSIIGRNTIPQWLREIIYNVQGVPR